MSAVVSEMLIRIAADTAQLRSQMDQAKATVESSFAGMEKAISLAKTAFIGFVGVASVKAFADMISATVDAMGAMHDLATQTGLSVAALQQFKAVGALSSTSIDSIATSTTRLSKALSLTDEEGKGAALAIQALGIRIDEFKRMSPEQQMLTVASALNKFQDGADKSAAAMMLFGREGAKLLPFLKDLAESADEVNAKLTDQEKASRAAAAAMADAYGDNLVRIQKQSAAWKKDLAEGLLPVMYETSQAFLDVFSGAGGLRDQLKELVANGTVAEWGRNAVTALTYLADALEIAWHGFKSLIAIMGDTLLAAVYAMQGEFKKAGQMLMDIPKDVAEQWGDATLGSKFRARMADLKGVQIEAGEAKEKLNLVEVMNANEAARKREEEAAKAQAAAQKAAIAEYERAVKAGDDLTKQIDLKNEALSRELALGRDLTPVEKELLKLDQDLKTGKVALTAAQEDELRSKIKLGSTMESEIALRKEIKKAHDAEIDALYKHAASIEASTAKLLDENYALRNGKEALDELELSRLKDQRATMAEIVARENLLGVCNAETEAHRQTLAALNDLIAAREDNVHLKAAKEAADEWKKTSDTISSSLTDALMRGFESGKGFAQNLKDTLKNLFATLVLRPIIQPIAQGAAGMLLSLVGMSSANASTGGGFAGAANTLSSLYTGGMNFLNGSTISSGAAAGWTNVGDYLSTSSNGTAAGIGDWMQANGQMGSYLGTAGNAVGGYMLGSGINSAVSGKYSVGSGFNTVANIGAGVASAIWGPVGGAVVGAITGLINRAFGMGPKEITTQGVSGWFGNGNAEGQAFADWKQKGGWFRSDKTGTDTTAMTASMSDALKSGASQIFDQVKLYAEALKLPADTLSAVAYQFRITLTDDAEANKKAITEALQAYQDALTAQYQDVLVPFQKAGETLLQVMQRLTIIQGVSESLNRLGGAFSNFATASIDARESIIGLTGGIDALMQKANSFVSNYYSAKEQGGLTATGLVAALQSAGFSADQINQLNSRADYRALLEGIDVNTTTGQQQFAALLNLQDQFANVSQLLTDQGVNLTELAKQAPQVAALTALFTPTKTTADATETMVTGIDKSNELLNAVVDAVNGTTAAVTAGLTEVANSVGSAVSAAGGAASAAAQAAMDAAAASRLAVSAVDNFSLSGSQASYTYDLGGGGGGDGL